jgi:hypothetical protein
MASGLVITSDTLTPNLKTLPDHIDQYVGRSVDFWSVQTEAYAKNNAPWKDQTGNARSGLRARPRHDSNSHFIDVYHSVPYGIWLEVRFEGRYAIIIPTVKSQGLALMGFLRGMLKRVPK